MEHAALPTDKLEADTAADPGYEGWKRAKIERAKRQAGDRAAMVPAEQVWRDLGLEH